MDTGNETRDRRSSSTFAERLWLAIRCSGLSFREIARRAQVHLPEGMRISDVSVWAYAKGHRFPHRLEHVSAIAAALGLSYSDLMDLSRSADQTPVVQDLGDGRARLRLDVVLPSATALAIVDVLAGGLESEQRSA